MNESEFMGEVNILRMAKMNEYTFYGLISHKFPMTSKQMLAGFNLSFAELYLNNFETGGFTDLDDLKRVRHHLNEAMRLLELSKEDKNEAVS